MTVPACPRCHSTRYVRFWHPEGPRRWLCVHCMYLFRHLEPVVA